MTFREKKENTPVEEPTVVALCFVQLEKREHSRGDDAGSHTREVGILERHTRVCVVLVMIMARGATQTK